MDSMPAGVTTASELRAYYASVRARLWPVPPKAEPVPEAINAELPVQFQPEWKFNALTQEFSVRYAMMDDDADPALRDILRAVAAYYDVNAIDIKSRRRTRAISRPRHVTYYLCRTMTGSSLPQIGRALGGKDHTSVMHGIRKITALIETDEQLSTDIRAIRTIMGR